MSRTLDLCNCRVLLATVPLLWVTLVLPVRFPERAPVIFRLLFGVYKHTNIQIYSTSHWNVRHGNCTSALPPSPSFGIPGHIFLMDFQFHRNIISSAFPHLIIHRRAYTVRRGRMVSHFRFTPFSLSLLFEILSLCRSLWAYQRNVTREWALTLF